MTVRYEYKSECCGHNYVEQRGATEPMFFPKCAKCDTGEYTLIKETKLADDIEVQAAPVVEEAPKEASK